MPSSGSYTIETSGDCTESRADPILDYNASGNILATDDDGGGARCSRISYSFTQAGSYVVRVRGYSDGSGSYTVSFRQ